MDRSLVRWFEGMANAFERWPLQIICGYFLFHIVARAVLPFPVGFDEGEQLIVTQDIALGYNGQPPLYNWLQIVFFKLFGTNALAMILLKQVLLLGIFVLAFKVWRKCGLSVAFAAACTFSMVLITEVGWELQRTRTHLAAAVMMSVLFIWVCLCIFDLDKTRASSRQRWGLYLTLGVVVGLGFLAKYNFLFLPAACVLVSLTLKRFRSYVLTPFALVSLLASFIVVAPHLWWVSQNLELIAGNQNIEFFTGTDVIAARISGLLAFGNKLMMFFLQAAILFCFMLLDWRDWKIPNLRLFSRLENSVRDRVLFIGYVTLVAFGLTLLAAQVAGLTSFKSRWFVPFGFLSLGPVLLMSRALEGENVRRMYWLFVGSILVLTTIVTLEQSTDGFKNEGSFANLPVLEGENWRCVTASPANSTVLLEDRRIAALIRFHCPQVSVVSPDYKLDPCRIRENVFVLAEKNEASLSQKMQDLVKDFDESRIISKWERLRDTGMGMGMDSNDDSTPWYLGRIR